jgi:beta,beta-carotene 9',10'-dioxygenase
VVLSEFPFVVDPLRLALSGRPFISNYRWEPERGTRFTVVDRRSGAVAARIQGEACFAFHHINAYEVGQSLIVDLCAAPDPSIIDELYLDRLRARLADPLESFADYPQPVRFTVDLPRRTAERRVLSDLGLDLPSVDHRQVRERPYRTVWGVGTGGNWMDRIHAVDVSTGESRTWQEPHTYPGEPVFVSRPGSSTEADGILLTVALDSDRGTSALVALDPETLDCLARAEVGRPIPYGFHGLYTADGGSQPARRPGG